MIIKSKRVWGESTFSPAALLIENGKVAKWLPYDSKADVDYNNHMIIPGLIDIHTHEDLVAMQSILMSRE